MAAKLIMADPEPDAADVMESQAESLDADHGHPTGAVRFTDEVPPLPGTATVLDATP